MKSVDIMEVIISSIENIVLEKWKHEGFIGGWTSDSANFEIDGKEYALKLFEVSDGQHFSEV